MVEVPRTSPSSSAEGPFAPFLRRQTYVVLDGGSATTLEIRGHVLDDALWSARLLLDAPDAVRALHEEFLDAGADCITTLSYQASFAGLARLGLSDAEIGDVLRESVSLALEAKHSFWSEPRNRAGRLEPIVAASAGAYGAYLADGSEYRGRYGVGRRALRDFHRRRFEVLAGAGADVVAFETIPVLEEAEAIADLLRDSTAPAWVSFSCVDGRHLRDGQPLARAVRAVARCACVVGVGINCTHPRFVDELIGEASAVTELPIIVYPNSGETYDAVRKVWSDDAERRDWAADARRWAPLGASVVGGCCRVGPADVRAVRGGLALRPLPPPRDRV